MLTPLLRAFLNLIQFFYIILIFSRGHAIYALKRAVKGALTCKSGAVAYSGYRVVCGSYEPGGVLRAYKSEIVRQADFYFVRECARYIKLAYGELFRKRVESYVFEKIPTDIAYYFLR